MRAGRISTRFLTEAVRPSADGAVPRVPAEVTVARPIRAQAYDEERQCVAVDPHSGEIRQIRQVSSNRDSQARRAALPSHAGGGTRTPDTRIMMADTQRSDSSASNFQARQGALSSDEVPELGARSAARRKRKKRQC